MSTVKHRDIPLNKISDWQWEIPISYRNDMRVPARIYASEQMLESIFRDRSLQQLVNVATLPGILKAALLMPDAHEGYGFPIGGVAATEYPDGLISPGGIGYDINCGVRLLTSQTVIDEVKPHMEKLAQKVFENVPSGVGKAGHHRLSIKELDEVPDDTTVIFSAHGVAKQVREEAARRKLRVYDAICPLVTKVHMEVGHYQDEGRECILIGHEGHPEVEGTLGQYQPKDNEGGMYLVESVEDVWNLVVKNPDFLAFVTQTTLSMDDTAEVINALRDRFPSIAGPRKEDICYATQNRQDAVKNLSKQCDLILVVGSPNSSNSTRLMEISEKVGVPSYLIDNASEIKQEWLDGKECVGVTAGASAPEVLVDDVIKQLQDWGADSVEEAPGEIEKVVFYLPKELAKVEHTPL